MGKGSNLTFKFMYTSEVQTNYTSIRHASHYTSIRVVLFLILVILPVISIGSGFLPIAHLDV
jgi:hypothetical protein